LESVCRQLLRVHNLSFTVLQESQSRPPQSACSEGVHVAKEVVMNDE
jgi:hypothetical protein